MSHSTALNNITLLTVRCFSSLCCKYEATVIESWFLEMTAYSVIVKGLCCHFSGCYKLPIAFSNVTWTCTWNQQTLQLSMALSQARGTNMLPETTANCDWKDECKQEEFLMTECNLKCKDRAHSYFDRF